MPLPRLNLNELPRLVSPEYSIIFGHWASLEGKGVPEGIYGLDTGQSDVPIYFIEYDEFFGRKGLYGEDSDGFSDNDNRYIFFQKQ